MGAACGISQTAMEANRKELSLIVLGEAGVGKSTIFKQIKKLYVSGFTDSYRELAKGPIIRTLLLSMQSLLQEMDRFNLSLSVDDKCMETFQKMLSQYEQFDQYSSVVHERGFDENNITPIEYCESDWNDLFCIYKDEAFKQILAEMAEHKYDHNDTTNKPLKSQESDETSKNDSSTNSATSSPQIDSAPESSIGRNTIDGGGNNDGANYQDESHFLLPPSGEFYISKFEVIMCKEYVPDDNDILRLRRVTEAASIINFVCPLTLLQGQGEVTDVYVKCTDVGGQAHHEYDWVKHGRNCDGILFVVELNQFDRVDPDTGINRVRKQLRMLRKIAQSEAFAGNQIVILFNKADLLEDKLKHTNVGDYFRSYSGDNSPKDVTAYFREKCEHIINDSDRKVTRQISSMQICALDSDLMENVLKKVIFGLFRSIFSGWI